MEISRPNAQELTPQELQDLEKLKAVIERAVADGRISPDEIKSIKATMWSDHKITPQELDLMRTLVTQKIESDELELTW